MWHLYKFIDKSGRDVIRKWMAKSIQKPDLARLERKLEALQDQGPDLSSDLLSDTPSRKIKKIRVNGRVAIRLLSLSWPHRKFGVHASVWGERREPEVCATRRNCPSGEQQAGGNQ